MDYYDPFPRPFRSTIAHNAEGSGKQKERGHVESAPWPNNESLSPSERAIPADKNAAATVWPNFMNLPAGSELNQGLPDLSLNARVSGEDELSMQVPAFGAISHTPNPPLNGLHENESSLGHGQRSSMTADTNTLDAPSLSKQLKTSPQNVEVQAQSSNDPSPTFARIPKRKHAGDEQRIFCCTFCRQNFKTKYDWSRHEKSLHLDLEAWTCAPESGIMNDPFTGHDVCAYCIHPQPTTEHVEAHNHSACLGMARTFSRKDHLVQHLRLVHRLTEIPPLDGWRVQAPPIVCRCGFCGEQLTGWGKRTDHLAGHFRKGATMHGWQGEHGFAAEIAAQVRNSIPPYLIADHALSSMDCGE